VFTIGDAKKISTWSNVPYFFTKSLEEKNIRIHRVDIEENALLNVLYKYSVYIFLKLLAKNSAHTYFSSGLNYFLTNFKIRRAIKRNSRSDLLIFLTYSFSTSKRDSKKIILFSDWSYLYKISTFENREPYWFERNALQREKKHINRADFVLSLFPGSKDFNLEKYNNPNCYYLGNVINSETLIHKNKLAELKLKSKKLLFIGNKKYLRGALDLIQSFKEIQARGNAEAELHIIGLNPEDTGITLNKLFYYGYLDKGYADEHTKYYSLISEARYIVNTTPGWGAFSAMTEAMYYYTPVITTAYSEFVNTYGSEIQFGAYVADNSPDALIHTLETLLDTRPDAYLAMMEQAHEKVKDFTWSNYTEKLLALIS